MLPTVLEARKSKIKLPEDSVSAEGLFVDASCIFMKLEEKNRMCLKPFLMLLTSPLLGAATYQ